MWKVFVKGRARKLAHSLNFAVVITLSACAGYDISLNDRLIYTPKELFTEFSLTDAALHDCVRQTVEYQKASSASQLTTLNCSGAGITTLAGLHTFSQITHLKLSTNKISSLEQLASLTKLQVLHIDENQLEDISALSLLPALKSVGLKKNPALDCSAVLSLQALRPILKISFPEHCKPR